jgi:hypothetical protein
MSDELDDFDPEPEQAPSWLKDDWNGIICYARWEQQGQGNWALQLKSLDEGTGEEYVHQPISVGGKDKGWASHDGGDEIMGVTENQRFHARSNIQKWIDAAMAAGAKDELLDRSRTLYGKRGRMFAALWMDLRFHYDVVPVMEDRPDKTKEDGRPWIATKVQVMKPTKFLGVGNANQLVMPTSPPSATSSTTQTGPSTFGATDSNGGSVSDRDLATLKIMAMAADTYGEFADAVMDSEDGSGTPFIKNTFVRKNLGKESWYQELRA